MAPDPADPAAAILAGIKRLHRRGYTSNPRRYYCYADNQDWPCDVSCLVAAMDAALKAADSARATDRNCACSWCAQKRGEGLMAPLPLTWDLDPAKLREDITAALTGKESSDEQ
jgi:hypothetical protein